MSLTFYIEQDWEVVDRTHTITFLRKQDEANFAPGVAVENVLREDVSKEEMQARYLLAKAGVVWHLWAAKLDSGGAAPKVGDVVLDSSAGRWTVKAVGVKALSSRYELATERER